LGYVIADEFRELEFIDKGQEAMIINTCVPLHRLVLSLSKALDCIHPDITDHQHRVAYISLHIGRKLGMQTSELITLFHAAALHDIGMLRVENRIKGLHLRKLEAVSWHSEVGYELLKDNPLLRQAAEIILHHHIFWSNGKGAERNGQAVPLSSHIIAIADAVERSINRDAHILDQAEKITNQITMLSGRRFHPDCIEVFREISEPDAFWLDVVSDRIYSILLDQIDWPNLSIDEKTLGPIAEMFGRIVDSLSPWTATHSAGVSASAVVLAEKSNFSPRELGLMRAAGYLHDLGKLKVPTRILNKPGKLTPAEWSIMKVHVYDTFMILKTIGGMPQISEWAAFHHERLDGTGYPFRHKARDLTLGARIMAVADCFTALSEERPYRKGLAKNTILSILERQAADGALDANIVSALANNFDEIDTARQTEQSGYAEKQKRLDKIIAGFKISVA